MRDYRRTTPCWLISQALCFSLLLQGSGIAEAAQTRPRQSARPSWAELESQRAPGASDDASLTPVGWLAQVVDDTWSSIREHTGDLAGALRRGPQEGRSGSEWGSSAEKPPRVSRLGGALPLPPRLMVARFSGTPQRQKAPPSLPGMAERQREEALPSDLASLLEKAALDEIPLVPGFNLISIPEEPADTDPAAVFAAIGGQYTRVFAYDACDPADPWKVDDPADPAASDLTAVDHRLGLWVDATAATALPSDGTLPASTTIDLCFGWNLIGFPAGEARHPLAVLSSIAGKWQRLFGYDAFEPADPWEVYGVGVPAWANDLQVMQPGRGYWLLVTEPATLEIRNQGPPPTVAISAPADLAVVTEPIEIAGTAESDRLESWTLSYRAIGEADAVTLATSNAPVSGGSLATFDPTLLLNGLYELELTATDVQGQQVSESIAVAVEGQMKIGHFTLSFVDLAVPVSGLAIEVVRTYDSRDKRQGDFGVGWSLDVRQGSYRNNRPPGDGWQLQGSFLPCDTVLESKSHLTIVRLSDQEVYRFALRLENGVPSTSGGCFADARFDFVDGPLPGTTLNILGQTQVFWANGSDQVVDVDTFELYEPEDVKLTTRDGRIFELDLTAGVTRLEDLNGNQLTITPAGITHSSGRGIAFARDAAGRITRITDPLGREMTYAFDAAGDLVTFTDRGGAVTRFTYDGDHRLLDIEDPRGVKPIRNEYDAQGRLVRHVDAFGKVIELGHDRANRREVVTNRLGASRVLEYDGRGNVLHETDELGKVTTRTFDSRDKLLTETDPLGRTTTRVYTASGDLASITDAAGETTTYSYNSRGQLLTVTDSEGGVTTNSYDSRGNPTRVTDASGNDRSFTYDTAGNLLSVTDGEGVTTRYEYDAFGNPTKWIDPLGNETVSTYDSNSNRLTWTRSRTLGDGSTETLATVFTYDSLDRLTATIAADGSTTETSRDVLGRVTSRTDELGRQTTMAYDLLGQLSRIDFPDGTSETRSYDAEGNVVAQTDAGGRVTSFSYDAAGRLLSFNLPNGALISQTFDDAGQVVATTDARGNTTSFTYDLAGRRTAIIDPAGDEITVAYDGNGRQVSETDALGNTSSFAYDGMGRVTTTTLPDGTTLVVSYDATGRRISETDQAGLSTRFGYDALGRLTSVTDALDQVTQYGYDEVGNRVSQVDANGITTRFEYDRAGRLTRKVFADAAKETFTYNADGTLATHTDAGGAVRIFEYDAGRRLIRQAYSDGSETTFTYTPTGRRASVTDARGTTTYTYDVADQLTEKVASAGYRLTYGYDQNGNRVSLTATVGAQSFTTTYSFDYRDRMTTVTDALGRVTSFDYDANGNRTGLGFPNGLTSSYLYDPLNRLVELRTENAAGDVVQSYDYALDVTGRRTRVDEHDGTSRQYLYDGLYRLTEDQVTDPLGARVYRHAFAYDPVGNRLSQTVEDAAGTQTIASVYDSRDRLRTAAATTYDWDIDGHRVSRSEGGTTTYGWDLDHRLESVTLPDGTVVRNVYDADGNRVRREITPAGGPTAAVDYLVDTSGELSQVVAEIVDGAVDTFYTRGGGQLVNLLRPVTATQLHYHTDGLGSVRALSGGLTGMVTDRYAYTAFGEILEHDGTDPNAFRFVGEQSEPATGLYYLRARWLDPATGLFLSMDPFAGELRAPMSLHRFNYAHADPVNFGDPSGQFLSVVGLGAVFAFSLALFSAGTASAQVASGEAWPHIKNAWDPHDVDQFRTWIKNEHVRYIGRNIDCADVAVDMLILFAAQQQLPVHLDAKEIRMDSKNAPWKGVDFREEAQSRLNAKKVFERNTIERGRLPMFRPQMGDLLMSKTHTRIFLEVVSGGREYSYVAGDLWVRRPTGIPKSVVKKEATPGALFQSTPSVRWWDDTLVFRSVIP